MSNQLADDEDHIYYNINIRKGPENKGKSFRAEFDENRVEAVLNKPSDYVLAVVRFSIPSQNIPIFIWKENEFKVTISYQNFDFTTTLQWIPNSPGGTYDYFGPSIWNYQDFIDSINAGLLASFNNFVAGTPAFAHKPTTAPYMIYTAESELCSLIAEEKYDVSGTYADPVYIYFNSTLTTYFPALQNFENETDPIKTYYLKVKDNFNNVSVVGGITYYEVKEEYTTLFLWNDMQKILLETDSIPVNNELLGSQTNKTRKIITDFEPLSNINDRSQIQYFPQGPLRFYDLISDYPLKRINLRFYWETKDGRIFPIYLNDYDNCSVKIYFKRKGQMIDY
jgi:hypothetical protein